MAGTEALLFFVVVPVLAFAADFLLLRGGYETAQRDLASRGLPAPPSRLYVLMGYGAFPVVLGLVLWTLSRPLTDRVDSGSSAALSDLQALIVWAAVAYGVAATVTALSWSSVLRARMASALGSDFGRVLPVAVVSFTGTIFALVLAFLLFGYVETALDGGLLPNAASVDTVVLAFQGYAVATVALLAGALASNRVRDLSLKGMQRALAYAVLGELPALWGLVVAFLSIRALYPP